MLVLRISLSIKSWIQACKNALLLFTIASVRTLTLVATCIGGPNAQIHFLERYVILAGIAGVVVVDHGYLDGLVSVLRICTVAYSDVALCLLSGAPWVLATLLVRVHYICSLAGSCLHHT